jgi:SAM-dependent methyltransferase
MQTEFVRAKLRCPACKREHTLRLIARETDEREVREGTLHCDACSTEFSVHRGVAGLLFDPPEHIVREAAGLERFAEYMRADGWDRERVRRLPNVDDGYWYAQAASMQQILSTVNFRPGQSLVDVGSNTCWASNMFAAHGLDVVALDIATAELQGLYTADYFIEDGTSYFERVLGSMYDMPFASASLDYVFCCEVLHHNDPESLRRTFEEAYRVIKPGGRLLIVNETIKTVRDRQGVHVDGVEQFEGYEHAFWALRYRWEAIRAGFRMRLLEPNYHWFFRMEPPFERPSFRSVRKRLLFELQRHRLGRRAYLEWLQHYRGEVALGMIGTKPPRGKPRRFRQRTRSSAAARDLAA